MRQSYIIFLRKYPRIFRIAQKVYHRWYVASRRLKKLPRRISFKIIKNEDIVEKILLDYPMICSEMVTENHVRVVLTNLKEVLDKNIEGDIVELGCNVGTTSLFIRKLLDQYKSKKKFHVYDSFEGLPSKDDQDNASTEFQYKKGACKTEKERLINNFKSAKLKLPEIHTGWFGQIPDEEYPKKIAFAFFDGDFYNSILDSFDKVYPKLVRNARVTIHDYQWEFLPGVEKACLKFLKNKPEKGTLINNDRIGVMVKI
jgi:O-methyltransferase